MKRNPNPARCGVCDRRCRDDHEAFECERAHDGDDPCWKCGVVHGHAPSCVYAIHHVPERKAA